MGSEVKVILSGLITQSRISEIIRSNYWTDKIIEDSNDGYISFTLKERTRIMSILHHWNYKEYADWLEHWVEKSEKESELRDVLKSDYTILYMHSDCYSIGLMKHILYILGGWIDYDDCDDSGFEYISSDENDNEDEYFPKRSKRIEVDASGYCKEDDREIFEAVDKASKCLVESIVFDIGKEYNINDLRLLILYNIYDKLNNAIVNGKA
jgi:hypothetical protein